MTRMKILLVLLSIIVLVVNQEPCRVFLYPSSTFIGVVGFNYLYFCQGWNLEDSVTIRWHLNGKTYSNGAIDNVMISEFDMVGVLQISNASNNLNNTEISCFARYSENNECVSTSSTFLIQGNLSEVTGINLILNLTCSSNGTISITWDSPFTLDLSDINNDIEYKVVVLYNESTKLSTDMITENSYTDILPDSDYSNVSCGTFNITVIPYNGAGFGQSTTITKTSLDNVEAIEIVVTTGAYLERNQVLYTLHSYPAICGIIGVILNDIYYGDEVFLSGNNINVTNDCTEESVISLTTFNTSIIMNRRYNAAYLLSNSDGGSTQPRNIINTHDIQNILIDYKRRILRLKFLENSTAKGALLVVHRLKLDNLYCIFIPISRDIIEYSIPSFMSDSSLLAFDIEEEGYLMPGMNYPAKDPIEIPGTQNKSDINESSNIVQCLRISSKKVTVMYSCACEELSTREAYQIILLYQSDPNGRTYANNSNCSNPVILEVEKYGIYYVAAFAIENNTGILNSSWHYSGTIIIEDSNFNVTEIPSNSNNSGLIGVIIGTICGLLLCISCITATYLGLSSKRKRVLKITHKMDGSAHTPISEEQETIDENEQESFAVEYVEILDEKTDGNLIAAYKKGSS